MEEEGGADVCGGGAVRAAGVAAHGGVDGVVVVEVVEIEVSRRELVSWASSSVVCFT